MAASADRMNRVNFALDALKRALNQSHETDLSWIEPPPSVDGWTLAPDALRLLGSIVSTLRPKHILEFGSGLSTRVMAHECARLNIGCHVSSVDHDPEFAYAFSDSTPREADARVCVSLQIVPLVAREYCDSIVPVYLIDRSRFASPEPPELVVIDGPPQALGGREGVLYQVMEFVTRGALVLLDDADRPQERAALQRWANNLGNAIEIVRLQGFERGMAAVVIREPVPKDRLLAHRLDLTRHEVNATIPFGKRFVVAGDDWWREAVAVGRNAIPFLESGGQYAGPPIDKETAVAELDRLQHEGAASFVLGWPVFWWLDYYHGLEQHLRANFRCVFENNRVLIFELRVRTAAGDARERT